MKTKANKPPIKRPWNARAKAWDLDSMKVGDERIITESTSYFRYLVSRKFKSLGWEYSTWSIQHAGQPALRMVRMK